MRAVSYSVDDMRFEFVADIVGELDRVNNDGKYTIDDKTFNDDVKIAYSIVGHNINEASNGKPNEATSDSTENSGVLPVHGKGTIFSRIHQTNLNYKPCN